MPLVARPPGPSTPPRRGRAERRAAGAAAVVLIGLAPLVACSGSQDGAGGHEPSEATSPSTASSLVGPSERGAAVARPTVAGPVTGGRYDLPFNVLPGGVADEHGYVEEEFLISGEARAYEPVGEWGSDGRWEVTEGSTAPYVTRIVVRRPADPADFDGTAIVEWHNVSSGLDANPDLGLAGEEAFAHGSAWVGVSAQRVGVDGEGPFFGFPGMDALPLLVWDPDRYAGLSHPGDEYSYDIFSQAGQALLRPDGVDPLGGLVVEQLLAVGMSQSGARLLTYVNAIHPHADLYDGFLIHSRSGGGAVLSARPDAGPVPSTGVRTDLDDPVLQLETETDLFELGFVDARQPDTDRIRTWEVAGAAHLDASAMAAALASTRRWDPSAELDPSAICGYPINDGPAGPVLRRALADLRAWAAGGDAPAVADPIETSGGYIARDDAGIARGGVRTPAVDAPVAVLSGVGRDDDNYLCSLLGTTDALDDAALLERYGDRAGYVAAVTTAAEAAVAAGHLLPADADRMIVDAEDRAFPAA